jgi:hypothetical protein
MHITYSIYTQLETAAAFLLPCGYVIMTEVIRTKQPKANYHIAAVSFYIPMA